MFCRGRPLSPWWAAGTSTAFIEYLSASGCRCSVVVGRSHVPRPVRRLSSSSTCRRQAVGVLSWWAALTCLARYVDCLHRVLVGVKLSVFCRGGPLSRTSPGTSTVFTEYLSASGCRCSVVVGRSHVPRPVRRLSSSSTCRREAVGVLSWWAALTYLSRYVDCLHRVLVGVRLSVFCRGGPLSRTSPGTSTVFTEYLSASGCRCSVVVGRSHVPLPVRRLSSPSTCRRQAVGVLS